MALYPLLTEKQTFFDANSNELSGGKLFIYAANTTTKVTTYAETDGLSANSNPILLNSRGEVPNGMYVDGSVEYKLVLAPSTDSDPPTSPIWTRDDLTPLGFVPQSALSEWQSSGATATQTGASTFTVSGDQRGVFQVGRRVRAAITAAPQLSYGTVSAASFGAGVTTVTLSPVSTSLDGGLTGTIPDVGLLQADNPSVPVLTDNVWQVMSAGDKTKKYALSLAQISPAQTRTRTVYDKSGYDTVANDIWGLHNAALNADSSGGNLVLELRTNAGAVPSASDPAIVGFRNSSSASGTPVIVAVTSATTFTVAAGSTLGFANGEAGRIWVCAVLNAGTVELACYRAWNGTGWRALNEQVLNTTAEGTGTADSAQVLYSTTARVGVPMRYLGYVEIAYGTAQWSNSPTFVQTNHSRMPLPGDIVGQARFTDGATPGGGPYTTNIPFDTSVPQNTEGTQFMSLAYTPSSALNLLRVDAQGLWTTSGAGDTITAALFRDSGANALAATASSQNVSDPQFQNISYQAISGTVSSTTFAVRAGGVSTNSIIFNGINGVGSIFGGSVMNSFIRIEEVFV